MWLLLYLLFTLVYRNQFLFLQEEDCIILLYHCVTSQSSYIISKKSFPFIIVLLLLSREREIKSKDQESINQSRREKWEGEPPLNILFLLLLILHEQKKKQNQKEILVNPHTNTHILYISYVSLCSPCLLACFSHNRGNTTTTTTISTMCEPVSNYSGQRQCGYCQLMMGNGPIATMEGHAGLTKNSFTSHTIDNCNGIKGNAISHVWHTTT